MKHWKYKHMESLKADENPIPECKLVEYLPVSHRKRPLWGNQWFYQMTRYLEIVWRISQQQNLIKPEFQSPLQRTTLEGLKSAVTVASFPTIHEGVRVFHTTDAKKLIKLRTQERLIKSSAWQANPAQSKVKLVNNKQGPDSEDTPILSEQQLWTSS